MLGDKFSTRGCSPDFLEWAPTDATAQVWGIDPGMGHLPFDMEVVQGLMESIENSHLLNPIGVKIRPSSKEFDFDMVYGRHRLEAFRRLLADAEEKQDDKRIARFREIPVRKFAANTPDDVIRYIEIVENLIRKELTSAEKKLHRAELVKWLKQREAKEGTDSDGNNSRNEKVRDTK